jgi:hypothetical protein
MNEIARNYVLRVFQEQLLNRLLPSAAIDLPVHDIVDDGELIGVFTLCLFPHGVRVRHPQPTVHDTHVQVPFSERN